MYSRYLRALGRGLAADGIAVRRVTKIESQMSIWIQEGEEDEPSPPPRDRIDAPDSADAIVDAARSVFDDVDERVN